MVKITLDKQGLVPLESIEFEPAFPFETKEEKFYIHAEKEMWNIKLKFNGDAQGVRVSTPPSQMKQGQIWEGTIFWTADLKPLKSNVSLEIYSEEVNRMRD